jgi:hypothetical protein
MFRAGHPDCGRESTARIPSLGSFQPFSNNLHYSITTNDLAALWYNLPNDTVLHLSVVTWPYLQITYLYYGIPVAVPTVNHR